MRQTLNLLGILLLLTLLSCGLHNKTKSIEDKSFTDFFNKYSNDSTRYKNFKIAYNNKSTAPTYIVFKAKDLNSGQNKEICCEAPFLSGALHIEMKMPYDAKGTEHIDSIILANSNRNFEFKNKESLQNISFSNYPNYDRIIQMAKGIDLEYYHNTFGRNDSSKLMYFKNDTGFVQVTFAHIMYNCGILTNRDCEAGNNIWFGDPNR